MSTFPSLSTPMDTLNATRGADVRNSIGDISKLQTAEDTDKVARKFEALLIHNMLKAMRTTTLGEEPSNERAMYNDMFDQEMSKVMSESGGMGIADSIRRQLNAQNGITEAQDTRTLNPLNQLNELSLGELDRRRQARRVNQIEQLGQLSQLEIGVSSMSNAPSTLAMNGHLNSVLQNVNEYQSLLNRENTTLSNSLLNDATNRQPSSGSNTGAIVGSFNNTISNRMLKELEDIQLNPQGDKRKRFIETLMPDAQRSANRLGVEPQVVIAIAALETGWGKHVMQNSSGLSSNNLFGIKRHGKDIPYTENKTTEFINNKPITVNAEFRSYNARSSSVDDFATFILSNPRYAPALNAKSDSHAFLHELQRAGYATDPEYANKAINVLKQVESLQQGPAL